MIGYPIRAALKSEYIDYVYVSTDDSEIADIAKSLGAQVPFLRPNSLADDHTPTKPVVAHSLVELQYLGIHPDHVCCIYPCTPLMTSDLLDRVFCSHKLSSALFAYPVLRYSHPIQRAMSLSSDGLIQIKCPEHELTRTQDLALYFHDAGQFYWGRASAWLSSSASMHADAIGVEVKKNSVVDIDSFEDLEFAKLIHRLNCVDAQK